MELPITSPHVLARLGYFRDKLHPFTVVTIPFPKKEATLLWTGCFILLYKAELDDLDGRPMVNVVSGETFYICDRRTSASGTPPRSLCLRTMKDEIDHALTRCENKFRTPNGSACTSRTMGLLARRHLVAGEFHYVGKEASSRWASGLDLSMMVGAGALDIINETHREYERVVDPKYLAEIRMGAKQFSTKLLSRKAALAECAIRDFKNGKNTIRPRSLRKLTKAIHDLQNKRLRE